MQLEILPTSLIGMCEICYLCNGGSRGRKGPAPRPKFLNFHAIFRKNWSNSRLMPPLGNPGSTTALSEIFSPFKVQMRIWRPTKPGYFACKSSLIRRRFSNHVCGHFKDNLQTTKNVDFWL